LRMHWEENGGGWQPVLSAMQCPLDEEAVIERLVEFLNSPPQLELLEAIGPNLTISGHQLHYLARHAIETCQNAPTDAVPLHRAAVDYVAAFGCDALTTDGDPDSTMQDTALRTMSGAGHQHFIAFMRQLISSTDAGHLRSTLLA